jgi:hypothetical protein
MILAHTFGTGGPDVELLLVAVALLAMSVVFFFSKTTKPMVPVVLMLGAIALGAGAFAVGGSQGRTGTVSAPDVTVEIVSPADGDDVPASRPIELEVSIEGGELTSDPQATDPTRGHLHVFVDGELIAMPATSTPEVELEPGDHDIAVEFTGADHRSFSPKIIDEVTVAAGEERG